MRTEHVSTYYTSMERLLDIFGQEARKLAFKARNSEEFRLWKAEVRQKLAQITGMDRMEKCDLLPQVVESEKKEDHTRYKLLIQTEAKVWMPFYLLVPEGIKPGEKRPCIITPHGHVSGGKLAPAGRSDIPAVSEAIERSNYDYGLKFVREGYMVFCPDARAFGERREWTKQGDGEDVFLHSACAQLNHMAICLGRSVTGMWVWDLMRLIDYVETRKDCDPARIGCAGLSGGGLQTLWLTAMDDRVRCAVVSGCFYGYKDALLKLSDNCACNYVPHLWEYVDMGDIGALIAPRPLLVESGTVDELNGERGIVNVTEQVEITRQAYQLFKAEKHLQHYVFEGPHLWKGDKTYEFVSKYI